MTLLKFRFNLPKKLDEANPTTSASRNNLISVPMVTQE